MALRAFARLLDLLGMIVGLVLAVIALLICLDILVRNGPDLLNWAGITTNLRPTALPWVTELTEYLMYGAAFIGAPWALRKGAHVRVDLFVAGLPPLAGRILNRVIDLVGLGISIVILWYGALAVLDAWTSDLVARKTWNFEEWILLLPIPLSGLLLAIEFVLRFLGLAADESGRDPLKKTAI